tara:strand:+ start:2643 stop:3785 length:1143 start_codon:yes stop_codon:yes gene_type:complete
MGHQPMSENMLSVPQGEFVLQRYPLSKDPTLRAWDAADEYILHHLFEQEIRPSGRWWIVNDGFGALAVALHGHGPTSQTDSLMAQRALRQNYEANGITEFGLMVDSLSEPDAPLDVVIIKVPKTLAWLEDILCRLKPYCHQHTQIIAAGMAKHIHTSTLALFEKYIGPTRTSLARKKARLIFSEVDSAIALKSPYPKSHRLSPWDVDISSHANVFGGNKLDLGTRFLLENLPEEAEAKVIADMGCGDGSLGLIAARQYPQAKLIFSDESYMAIASARQNMHACFGEHTNATYLVTDALEGVEASSVDWVLNNPPFHQQHAKGDDIAWNMFRSAKRALKTGGELWVVANRHLGYHAKLKKLFGNYHHVAANKKFVILKAVK